MSLDVGLSCVRKQISNSEQSHGRNLLGKRIQLIGLLDLNYFFKSRNEEKVKEFFDSFCDFVLRIVNSFSDKTTSTIQLG